MSDINVVHKTQRLIVDMPTRTVTFISAGPIGPRGEQGPTGSGAGGFNFTQVETPYATDDGETWYKIDTGEAFVWYDSFWIQFAPGPQPVDPYAPLSSANRSDLDIALSRITALELRVLELENQ
jgi:hypothetical protein